MESESAMQLAYDEAFENEEKDLASSIAAYTKIVLSGASAQ
jgi:hypothetical protein